MIKELYLVWISFGCEMLVGPYKLLNNSDDGPSPTRLMYNFLSVHPYRLCNNASSILKLWICVCVCPIATKS